MTRGAQFLLAAGLVTWLAPPAATQVEEVWVRHHPAQPGPGAQGMDVAVDAADDVVVVGSCNDRLDALTLKVASDGTTLWTRTYDGPSGLRDEARVVAVDATGNVFVAGSSEGTLTGQDILTLAYDPAGNLLWSRRYDGPASGDDLASDVAVDAGGHVYVTGRSEGTGTGPDVVTLAYDLPGNLLWARRLAGKGAGVDGGHALAIAPTGPVVAGGVTAEGPGRDYLILAYDAAGKLLWSTTYDGQYALDDHATDVVVDSSGGVLVTGHSEVPTPGLPAMDFWTTTVKLDAAGAVEWVHHFGSTYSTWVACRIALDAAGNVFVSGGAVPVPSGVWGSTVVKLDPTGRELWQRGTAPATAYALEVDAAGNVFVAGNVDAGQYPGGDAYDGQTWAYDPEGNQVWMALYDGSASASSDSASALALDSRGHVLVTGASVQAGTGLSCSTIQYEVTCACVVDVYCTAKPSSMGCLPAISLSNTPSASRGWGSFLRVDNLPAKTVGMFFHGTSGPLARPLHGGILCVAGALRRHPAGVTGNGLNGCYNSLVEDLNAYIASGKDLLLVPGATIHVQAWTRDPGDPFGDSLSDAVSAVICP